MADRARQPRLATDGWRGDALIVIAGQLRYSPRCVGLVQTSRWGTGSGAPQNVRLNRY
jgi:hypothetical protein